MTARSGAGQPARTVLEQQIRERRQTLREFVEFVEEFARKHNEPGTLSFRHLQRLVAGKQPDGSPLRPLRPATTRLLEKIFDLSINELLARPTQFQSGYEPRQPHPLTVSIAVVMKDTEVLIVCRRSTEETGITWQFPAGMVKPGMRPQHVAIRETLRETGVHCAPTHKLGRRVHPITNVICEYWLCEYVAGEATNIDAEENITVAWINREKLTRVIPFDHLYPPVLTALQLT